MSDVNKQLLALANEVKDAVIAEITKDNIISNTGEVIKRAKYMDLSAIVGSCAAEQAQPRCACGDSFTSDAVCANCLAAQQQAEPVARDVLMAAMREAVAECAEICDVYSAYSGARCASEIRHPVMEGKLADIADRYAAQPPAVADRDAIRRAFLAHGFTIKDGQTDLKPYVYEAAEALLRELSPAVAVPVALSPTAEQLYTMVTSRFQAGSFPWSMVSVSGKAAWASAAAELAFAPDTIMASHTPQPVQRQVVPGAVDLLREMEWENNRFADACPVCASSREQGHATDCTSWPQCSPPRGKAVRDE